MLIIVINPFRNGYTEDGKIIVSLLESTATSSNGGVNTFRSASLAELYGGSSNMSSTYKGLPGFEKNRFRNNTYQALLVINGSDWAAGANWMYAE